jgi:hypothetical protein
MSKLSSQYAFNQLLAKSDHDFKKQHHTWKVDLESEYPSNTVVHLPKLLEKGNSPITSKLSEVCGTIDQLENIDTILDGSSSYQVDKTQKSHRTIMSKGYGCNTCPVFSYIQ